jgi:uncharacterized protein (TIGR02118 family)
MIKFTILLRRNSGLTHEQFVAYHREQHAALFKSLPGVMQHVRRYVQDHSIPAELPGFPPLTFDGMTELWFDDIQGLAAVFQSQEYMERIRPDEGKFLDLQRCEFLLTTDNVVIS